MKYLPSLLLCGTLLFGSVTLSHAQSGALQRVLEEPSILGLDAERNWDAIIAEDAGQIIQIGRFHPQSLSINFDTRIEYNTNAELLGSGGDGDFLFIPALSVNYGVPLTDKFSFQASAAVESFLYTRFDENSFWGFTGVAQFRYDIAPEWPTLFIGTQPYHFNLVQGGGKLTQAVSLAVGLENGHFFNNYNTYLFYGYQYSRYYTSPSFDDRNSHRFLVGVSQRLVGPLSAQLFYSYQYTNFRNYARDDNRHLVGLNLIYEISPAWSARLTTSFVDNDSSLALASYQNFAVGVGGGFTFRF